MARYLVTYHGGGAPPPDPETMAKIREAFMQWAQKTGSPLTDPGAPVGSTTLVTTSGVSTGRSSEPFNGWSVIEAPNAEAAADLVKDHPFVARGGTLQINEPVEF
jgi:hypothetical protein